MYVQFCTFVDLRANSFGCLIMMMDYSHEIFSLYIFYFMFCLGSDRWCQLMWPTTQLTTASRPARRSASWSCPGWPPSSDLSQQHHPIMFRWGVTSHHHHPIMFRGGVTSQEHHLITFRWGVTSQQHHPIMGEAWRHSNIIQSWVRRVTWRQHHQSRSGEVCDVTAISSNHVQVRRDFTSA